MKKLLLFILLFLIFSVPGIYAGSDIGAVDVAIATQTQAVFF